MRVGLKKLFFTILILGVCLCAFAVADAATLNGYADPPSINGGEQTTIYLQLINDSANTLVISSISSDYSGFNFTYPSSIVPGRDGLCSAKVTIGSEYLGKPMTFTVTWAEYDVAGNYITTNSLSTPVIVNPLAGATPVPTGGLTATRTASAKQASPGESITITYVLTNTGNVPITNISITDKGLQSSAVVSGATLEAGESKNFEINYTMGYSTVTSAPVISYKVNGETKSLTLTELTLGMINNKLTVAVDQGINTSEGVVFTIYLTNNGNQKINKIRVKDELGNNVNSDSFALAIGESTTLTYTVPTNAERNVVFHITGTAASGDNYEDKTATYTVHKYIDPSLIGLNFGAEVTKTLDRNGSIQVKFNLNNTGVLTMYDVVLSEAEIGEVRRTAELAPGELILDETIHVGTPRDMVFTLSMRDESNNTYTYTANISASYVGVEEQQTGTDDTTILDDIGNLGATISSTVSKAVSTVLTVIAILTVVSGGALILLLVLENRQKKEAARKKAARERAIRERAARAAALDGETVYLPRTGPAYAGAPQNGRAPANQAPAPQNRYAPTNKTSQHSDTQRPNAPVNRGTSASGQANRTTAGGRSTASGTQSSRTGASRTAPAKQTAPNRTNSSSRPPSYAPDGSTTRVPRPKQ